MKDLFYRLSWDRPFRYKVLFRGSVGFFCLSLLVFIGFVSAGTIAANQNIDTFPPVESKSGNAYNLVFEDQDKNGGDENNNSQENNNNNNSASNNSENVHNNHNENNQSQAQTSIQQSQSSQTEHVHSWVTVVDTQAWTENVQVQVGCNYRCNQCGFTSNSASTMSSHCSSYSHSFTASPIYETRQVYHPGSSHQECSCGARK